VTIPPVLSVHQPKRYECNVDLGGPSACLDNSTSPCQRRNLKLTIIKTIVEGEDEL